MLVVAVARVRTTTALGHVVGKVWSVAGSEKRATGLVPGFAAYPSSTTVESERVGVMVVVWDRRPDLSDDKVTVEDVGSGLDGSKRWCRGRESDCGQSKRCGWGPRMGAATLEVAVEGVDDGRTVSSLDEGGEEVVVEPRKPPALDVGGGGVDESRWQRLTVVDAGVEGGRVMDVIVVDDVADGGGMEGVVMVMVVLGVLWVLVDGGFDETVLAV